MTDTQTQKGFLLSPIVDFTMIGGLSLILFPLYFLFVPKNQDIYSISIITFYLSFAINYPHFLISYQFLYIDNMKQMTQNWRLSLAGIIFPVIFLSYVIGSLTNPSEHSPLLLGYLINLMYFLVGHHYVKQIIGCVVVTSALKGVHFESRERLILSINMFAVWMISFINGNIGARTLQLHSIQYKTFNFPPISLSLCYGVIALSLLVLIWQIAQKFIQTGKCIPFNGLVALISIYLWHIPTFHHPSYFYMIPLFHSLQYMLFALTYVANRFKPDLPDSNSVQYRKQWIQGSSVYVLSSVILGALFFYTIPRLLDKGIDYDKTLFGPELFMFLFVIFINIHHYIIDFAIWRRDNNNVRRYLFT